MKLIIFTYLYNVKHQFVNLGDYIQSIAVEKALLKLGYSKNDFIYHDRDYLSYYDGEEAICIMQGWFSDSLAWIPSTKITPLYIGFHANQNASVLIKDSNYKNHFLNHKIGCRDITTKKIFQDQGFDSYFSRCLTLTLDKRNESKDQNKTFVVDIPENIAAKFPEQLKKEATYINQRNLDQYKASKYYQQRYRVKAEELLKQYEDESKLIITSALHCALPCIALGIPVVFINPNPMLESNNIRFEVLRDLVPIYTIDDVKSGTIDWHPLAINIEDLKLNLLNNLSFELDQILGKENSNDINSIRINISKKIKNIKSRPFRLNPLQKTKKMVVSKSIKLLQKLNKG